MKKPTQSPEATTAKQTSSEKQLNPATCTKPSAVQQPSYSTTTSSQTLTDKTSCTTIRQLSSKPVKQVSTYHITELIHLTKAIASMDLPTDPDFENESIDECHVKMPHTSSRTKFWTPSKRHHCAMTSLSSLHLDQWAFLII